jgi:hypothetical protein
MMNNNNFTHYTHQFATTIQINIGKKEETTISYKKALDYIERKNRARGVASEIRKAACTKVLEVGEVIVQRRMVPSTTTCISPCQISSLRLLLLMTSFEMITKAMALRTFRMTIQ